MKHKENKHFLIQHQSDTSAESRGTRYRLTKVMIIIITNEIMLGDDVMPQIRPISDLRNTTEISSLCHNSNEPVFITKNGYGDLVVMSMKTYEKSMAKLELYQKLAEAENQIKNGEELLDGEEVFKKLRKKHGKN